MKRVLAIFALCLSVTVADARPARWCGWYARQLAPSDPGPSYNLACNWLHYGRPTTAHVGAFAIWCGRSHRHVGQIVGTDANGNPIVTSGNDGGRVRSRVRSLAGAQFRE